MAHHGSQLHGAAGIVGQGVEPGLQHPRQRGRQGLGLQPLRQELPDRAIGLDHALVDQHIDQLFHEERVAFGALGDQGLQACRPLRQGAEQGLGQLVGLAGVECGQGQALVGGVGIGNAHGIGVGIGGGPIWAAFEQAGPAGGQQQQRQVGVAALQVADEVQRAVVSPVQVVQVRHQGLALGGQRPQPLAGVEERAVTQLAGLAQQRAQLGVGREVKAQQMPQHGGVFAVGQQGRGGGQPGGAGLCGRGIAGEGAGCPSGLRPTAEPLRQQAIGLVDALLAGVGLAPLHAAGLGLRPMPELVDQTRFSQPGLAHHGQATQAVDWGGVTGADRCGRACGRSRQRGQSGVGRLQPAQLTAAAHHARAHAVHSARHPTLMCGARALHQITQHGHIQALEWQRCLRQQVEAPAHLAVGGLADAQRARRRGLLHARGDAHAQAPDAVLAVHPTAQQHAAGVQPHPHIEARHAVAVQQGLGLAAGLGQDRQPGQHRPLGIVFKRLRRAKHRQQAVAGILQDPTAMGFDLGSEARQRAVHHGIQVFSIQVLADGGRAHDVGKQHGGQFELGAGVAALGAVVDRRLRFGAGGHQLGPQAGHDSLHHRIAQHGTLGLQRADGGGDGIGGRQRQSHLGRAGVSGSGGTAADSSPWDGRGQSPEAQSGLVEEPVGLGERRLQFGRSGPFFTGFLSHSQGYGPANPAKTVLAGAKFRFDAPSPTGSQPGSIRPGLLSAKPADKHSLRAQQGGAGRRNAVALRLRGTAQSSA